MNNTVVEFRIYQNANVKNPLKVTRIFTENEIKDSKVRDKAFEFVARGVHFQSEEVNVVISPYQIESVHWDVL